MERLLWLQICVLVCSVGLDRARALLLPTRRDRSLCGRRSLPLSSRQSRPVDARRDSGYEGYYYDDRDYDYDRDNDYDDYSFEPDDGRPRRQARRRSGVPSDERLRRQQSDEQRYDVVDGYPTNTQARKSPRRQRDDYDPRRSYDNGRYEYDYDYDYDDDDFTEDGYYYEDSQRYDDGDPSVAPRDQADLNGNFWANPRTQFDTFEAEAGRRRVKKSDKERAVLRERRRIRRTSFRSGVPEPPAIAKQLYTKLFWQGFEPDESEVPSDKTVFGGTKGKFNALSFLNEGIGRSGKPPSRRIAALPPGRNDDYYDDTKNRALAKYTATADDAYDDGYDDYDYEDRYGDYDSDGYFTDDEYSRYGDVDDETYERRRAKVKQRQDYMDDKRNERRRTRTVLEQPVGSVIDERHVTPPEDAVEPHATVNAEPVSARASGRAHNSDGYGTDENESPQPTRRRESPPSGSRRRLERQRRSQYYDSDDSYDGDVDSDDGYVADPRDVSARRDRRQRRMYPETDRRSVRDDNRQKSWFGSIGRQDGRGGSWFGLNANGSDESNDVFTDRQSRRRGRRQQRRTPINIVDSFFGINREKLDRQARMYDRSIGVRRGPSEPRDTPSRRRPGYAYRYDPSEEDDNDSVGVDESNGYISARSVDGTSGQVMDATVVDGDKDVDVKKSGEEQRERPKIERSWEERALAMERIPPETVGAWGPTGDLGMDARQKAVLDALEDIQTARQRLERRRKREELAREDVMILKVDAERQRRRMREQRGDDDAAEELRQIEVDIGDASIALRRAKKQVELAEYEAEVVQERHWALLSLYDPNKASEMVDEALREMQVLEPAARLQVLPQGTSPDMPRTVPDVESAVSAINGDVQQQQQQQQ